MTDSVEIAEVQRMWGSESWGTMVWGVAGGPSAVPLSGLGGIAALVVSLLVVGFVVQRRHRMS
jgi:hypothetical protein